MEDRIVPLAKFQDEEFRLGILQDYAKRQFELVSKGRMSHGQAFVTLANMATYLNSWRQDPALQPKVKLPRPGMKVPMTKLTQAAIEDLKRVTVGDDITASRPSGKFYVRSPGGADGFRANLRDSSPQIRHAVAGMFMSSKFGEAGEFAAHGREAGSNLRRAIGIIGRRLGGQTTPSLATAFEPQDFRPFSESFRVTREARNGVGNDLARSIANRIGDTTVQPPADWLTDRTARRTLDGEIANLRPPNAVFDRAGP